MATSSSQTVYAFRQYGDQDIEPVEKVASVLDPPVFENARLIFPVYNHRHIIHWCTQLASVLSFLQDQQIVHGDLKPQNILMKYKRLSIRVCDFGSARDCASSREVSNWAQSQEQASTRRSYTPRYHAPQRGIGSGGFKDDIYSFGIILWQLLTRKEPYDKIPGDEVLARVAEGLRPPIDPAMPAVFEQILLRCWDQNIEACFEAPQLSYAMRQLADRFRDPLELLGTFGYRTRPDLDPESWAGTELKPLEGSTFSDLSTKQSGQSGSVEVELTGKMFDAVEGYWDYCQDYVNTNPPKKSSGRILKNVATYCFDTIHELSHLPDDPDLTTSVINQFPPLLRDFVAHMKD
ncbi:unnamed protein product, partial [Mesorhabditis spiculigera]